MKQFMKDMALIGATMIMTVAIIVLVGMVKTSKGEGVKTTSVVTTAYGTGVRTAYTWCFVTSYKDVYLDTTWFRGMQVFGIDDNPYSLLTAEG